MTDRQISRILLSLAVGFLLVSFPYRSMTPIGLGLFVATAVHAFICFVRVPWPWLNRSKP